MPDHVLFRAHGENAATFLIFQELARRPGALANLFLPRLKQFGTGRSRAWANIENPQIWLYPSFGRRFGFGEPDVLIITGQSAFWVEVETTVNGRSGIAHLRRALLQLWRFRLFQHALTCPRITVQGSQRIEGTTLTDQRKERTAQLVCNGHPVLKRVGRKLAQITDHHYVLFTVGKPKGEGGDGQPYAEVLNRELGTLSDGARASLPRLERERCWYAYWRGDLEGPFNQTGEEIFVLDDCYVGKANQRRRRNLE